MARISRKVQQEQKKHDLSVHLQCNFLDSERRRRGWSIASCKPEGRSIWEANTEIEALKGRFRI